MASGERALIAAFEELLANRSDRVVRWVGDDAAVVRSRPVQVVSVDSMVDGVHFRLDHPHVHPADAGWRALAAALSDIAAMGADAGEAYVAMGIPEGFGADADLARLHVAGREEVQPVADAEGALRVAAVLRALFVDRRARRGQ